MDSDDDEHNDPGPVNNAGLGLGSDDEEDDAASNAPPPPAPQQAASFPASTLRQSSLWGRDPVPPSPSAGGRGRGRGGGGRGGGGGGAGTGRFERLSALEMEIELRENGDGGASSLFSDDAKYQEDVLGKKKKRGKRGKRPHGASSVDGSVLADSEDGVERMDSEDEEADEDDAGSPSGRPRKRKSTAASMPSNLVSAALGGTNSKAQMSDSESESEDDENERRSITSSAKAKANKKAFPIKGVDCIGCALAQKIGVVEKFVVENISRMNAESVFKHASLVWKLEVVDKAKREGGHVPEWAWKDVRSHFLLHASHPVVSRQSTISQLQLMRTSLENRLLRVGEDGSKEIDRGNAELLLKVAKQESAERTLLANLMSSSAGGGAATGGAGKGGKATGGPTVG